MITEIVTYLAGLGADGSNPSELRRAGAELRTIRAAVDAAEARVTAAVSAGSATRSDALEAVRSATGCSQWQARRSARRAEALQQMPAAAALLAQGRLTVEHVDLLSGAARLTSPAAVDSDAELLKTVAACDADRAGKHIRQWAESRQSPADAERKLRRQRDRRFLTLKDDPDDGMVKAFAAFDPVSGASFRARLGDIAAKIRAADGAASGARSWSHSMMQALLVATGVEPPPARLGARSLPDTDHGVQRNDRGGGAGVGSGNGSVDGGSYSGNGGDGGRNGYGGVGRRRPGNGSDGGRNGYGVHGGRRDGDDRPAGTDGLGSQWCRCRMSRRHDMLVVVHSDTITASGSHEVGGFAGGGSIPQSEIERLACGSELIGALFSGQGEPLWHGRSVRRVTDAQWRMLVGRDRGCVLCDAAPMYCHAHHILPWRLDGPTDITNLALVCGAHHSYVHANGLALVRDPGSGMWHTRPDPRMAAAAAARRSGRPPPEADGPPPVGAGVAALNGPSP